MTDKKTRKTEPSGTDLGRVIETAKQELERMIDLNPMMMLLVDPNGRVLRANRALLQALELSGFDVVLGRDIWDLFPCERSSMTGLLDRYDGYSNREWTGTFGGHGERHLSFTIVGTGASDDPRVLIVEDVTEEKARAKNDEKEHKRAAVEALAGALKHRINQSLTVITVRSKLMLMALEKGSVDTDELRKSLQDITELALDVSQVLSDVEKPRDYVTEPYLADVEILDLKRSASGEDA